jgi:hypothetical protein
MKEGSAHSDRGTCGILWLGIVEDAEHETDRLGRIDGTCPVGEIFKKEAASRPSLRVGLEGE